MVADLPSNLWYRVCPYSRWTGNVQHGAFYDDDICGAYTVVAWTEAGVVGLAYELGFGPIAQLGMTPDTVTGGPDDVRGAVPGLPAELEPAFQLAANLLDKRSDVYQGNLPNKKMYSERLAGVGFWLHGDRVAGSIYDDPTLLGVKRLIPWGMLRDGKLPLWWNPEFAALKEQRVRTTDAPIHAIIDAVTDRALKGPTEFKTDVLASLVHTPPVPEKLLGAQRMLQMAGITWPGSPEIPPLPPPTGRNPFLPQSCCTYTRTTNTFGEVETEETSSADGIDDTKLTVRYDRRDKFGNRSKWIGDDVRA
jgi:hypothetical protein